MSGVAGFPQGLTYSRTSATAKNTFTTAATCINPSDVIPVPANYLSRDSVLSFYIAGALGNVVTAQPTFTFQIMLGAVAIWSSGALTTNATANTALPFLLELDLRIVTEGSSTSATALGVGRVQCAALVNTNAAVPITSPAAGTGFDSTTAANLDFFVACGTSNAANTFQVHNYRVMQLRFGS